MGNIARWQCGRPPSSQYSGPLLTAVPLNSDSYESPATSDDISAQEVQFNLRSPLSPSSSDDSSEEADDASSDEADAESARSPPGDSQAERVEQEEANADAHDSLLSQQLAGQGMDKDAGLQQQAKEILAQAHMLPNGGPPGLSANGNAALVTGRKAEVCCVSAAAFCPSTIPCPACHGNNPIKGLQSMLCL